MMCCRRIRPQKLMSESTLDWSGVPDESFKEILRQGEIQLEMLLRTSIAADQRAMTLAGVFAAVAVALFAGTSALLSFPSPDHVAMVCMGGSSVALFVASLVCAFSGRPRKYRPSGYQPKMLIGSAADTVWMLRYTAQDIQLRLEDNRQVLSDVGFLTHVGYWIAIVSLSVGGIAFVVLRALGI